MEQDQASPRVITAPNLLSVTRLAIAPVLLCFAWNGESRFFIGGFIVCLLTDSLDGFIARKRKQTSELGARLDTWGDFATYSAVALGTWWLRPEAVRREALFVIVAVASYALSFAIGLLKYGRFPSYHTWCGKVTTVLMGMGILALLIGGWGWLFRCTVPVLVLSVVEEIAITLLLPEWRANVPSLWHALKLNRGMNPPPGSR